jgi:hypothetical protein
MGVQDNLYNPVFESCQDTFSPQTCVLVSVPRFFELVRIQSFQETYVVLPVQLHAASSGPYCPRSVLHLEGHIAHDVSRQWAIVLPFRVASRWPYCPCCFTPHPAAHIAPVPFCIYWALLPVLLHAASSGPFCPRSVLHLEGHVACVEPSQHTVVLQKRVLVCCAIIFRSSMQCAYHIGYNL